MSNIDFLNHTFVNPYSYLVLRRNKPHWLSGDAFAISLDGISLVLIARLLGRVAMRRSFDDTSMAPMVFQEAAERNSTIAFVGSGRGVAEEAARLLKERYPALRITFTSDGFIQSEAEEGVFGKAGAADIVVCSMGTPKQEAFLAALRDRGWRGTGFTCGGYLDQLVAAGGQAYYPAFFDALHLRWLYRLIREPRRLWARYTLHYPLGMAMFAMDLVMGRLTLHDEKRVEIAR